MKIKKQVGLRFPIKLVFTSSRNVFKTEFISYHVYYKYFIEKDDLYFCVIFRFAL